MTSSRLLLVLASITLTTAACSGAPAEGEASQGSTLGGYTRRGVYDAVRSRARGANDLLRATYTDERLVAALGWLDDHGPTFTVSAIRSDHPTHDSSNAHGGGFSADLYATSSSQMRALLIAIDSNPYVYEVGFGGAYKNYRSAITRKAWFNDNNATHVHIGVIHAYGTCHASSCDQPAGASAGNDTSASTDTSNGKGGASGDADGDYGDDGSDGKGSDDTSTDDPPSKGASSGDDPPSK